MITQKKFLELIEKLLAKAQAGEVHWQKEFRDGDSASFFVRFRASKFYIAYESPPTEPDQIEVGIENLEGESLKRMIAEEDEDDPTWLLFSELYMTAAKSVTDWDVALSEIEEELGKAGAIGTP